MTTLHSPPVQERSLDIVRPTRRWDNLPALRMVEPPHAARRLAIVLTLLLISAPLALILLPWRQAVMGTGVVFGFAPLDRQQSVDAPVSGRVVEWFVREGTAVKIGDPIAHLADNDPELLARLEEQEEAVQIKRAAAREKARVYTQVIVDYERYREMVVRAAENQVEVAVQKVKAQEQELSAAQVALTADSLQFQRITQLHKEGLVSRRDYELADQKYRESLAKVQKARADLEGAKGVELSKRAELSGYEAEANTKIGAAKSSLQEAQISVGEYDKELQEIQNKISRQSMQLVTAPRDGIILRLLAIPGTSQVKQGDPIALMVPETPDLAVALDVDGNDAPLISAGRQVRLQFEGWPAVQFPGWPSIAVGTFGGIVSLVDASDLEGDGKFRILVVPDPEEQRNPLTRWPSQPWLRQGVRVKGWVLLNEVRLGYEIWRRLNGFPPVVSKTEPDSKGAKIKLPKT
jgi:adhesin transport system membrane fusion protein